MAQVPGNERCKHGEIAAWCGESECMAARKGLPVRVWRTPYGSAYHRTPTCQALLEGHRMAERYGRETHPAESVPLSQAMSAPARRMLPLFPGERPRGREAMSGLVGRGMGRRIPAGMATRRRRPVERPGELPARSRPSRRSQRPGRAQASWQPQASLTIRCATPTA